MRTRLTLDELAAASAPASRARAALVQLLADAGIAAADDPGAFFPQPVGVLVGLPTLVRRTLAARTFEIPVLIVSGDPVSSPLVVDRLYALADDVARALGESNYRPSTWRATANAEPLPAVELNATVTTIETEV